MSAAMAHIWHRHKHDAPAGAEELAALVAAARALLDDETDRLLRIGGEEPLTDAQIARWLAARGWDPARAAHDLAAHAAWRAAFAPAGRVLLSEVPDDVAQHKVLISGPDTQGRACVVFIGKNHIPRPDTTEVQRFFCLCADACIALADPATNPGGRVVFVFMSEGFGWANFDLAGLGMMFKTIHAHYVERLQVMYIHGASHAFQLLYKLVEPFVDPVTRRKVALLPTDADAAAAILARDIGAETLPPCLGGTAKARPVEDVWAELEARRAAGDEQPGKPWQQPLGEQGPAASEAKAAAACS